MTGATQVVYQNLRDFAGSPYWVVYQTIYAYQTLKTYVDATQGVYFGYNGTTYPGSLGLISQTGTLSRQFNFNYNPGCCIDPEGRVYAVVGDASGNLYATGTTGSVNSGGVFYQISSSNTATYYKKSSSSVGMGTSGIQLTSDGSTVQVRAVSAAIGWYAMKVTAGAYGFQKNIKSTTMTASSYIVTIEDFKTDASDFMYFAGYGRTPTVSYTHGYLVKVTADGATVSWARTYLISVFTTVFFNCAVDASSNVYACGDVATTPKQNFIVKYDSAGTLQWQRFLNINSPSPTGGSSKLTTDSSGNVYVGMGSSAAYCQTTICKFNSSGVLQWQRQFATASGSGEFYLLGLQVVGAYMYVSGYKTSNNYPIHWKLPIDGSLTATYTFTGSIAPWSISYEAAAYTDSAGTGTSATSSNWTTANVSFTLSNGTAITTDTAQDALTKVAI